MFDFDDVRYLKMNEKEIVKYVLTLEDTYSNLVKLQTMRDIVSLKIDDITNKKIQKLEEYEDIACDLNEAIDRNTD